MSREVARPSSFCFWGRRVPQEQPLPVVPLCPPAKDEAPAEFQAGPGAFPEPLWVHFPIRAAPGLEVWEGNPSWAGNGVADPAGRWPGLAPRGPGRLCHCLDRSGGCRRPIAGRVGAPGRVFRFPSLQRVGSKDLKLRKFFIKNGFPVFLKNGESWQCRGHLGRAGWS